MARQTTKLLSSIFRDVSDRRSNGSSALVHAFIRSECGEVSLRVALNAAAPRDALEAARASGDLTVQAFMREATRRSIP
jgi:hypothetical protein